MSVETGAFTPVEKPVEIPTVTVEVPVEAQPERLEHESHRQELTHEINEQIPFLAYGLSQKLAENGLRGKVSVRGIMGEAWGTGVSKNNPRKDIPNVIIYPESILNQPRSVANAQLRHEIGHLNHSLGPELIKLREWCTDNGQSYELMTPLIEAIQTASVDYLEMRNSIADDPADAFRPLYREVIDTEKMAAAIGSGAPYKQAVDMALLHSLAAAGLVPASIRETAAEHTQADVNDLFTPKARSVIEQAIKSSSGRIKVQLIRDYLWPEFSKLIPQGGLAESENGSADTTTDSRAETLEKLERNFRQSPEERAERQEINQALLQQLKEKTEQELSPEQIEALQEFIEQLVNPESIDQTEELEHFAYDIREVGIDETTLTNEQRELLGGLREFCQKTSMLYTKTMRFVMQQYQERNPNFTDSMLERMMTRHHDTPSFTIYGKEAGKYFIENESSELGIEQFNTEGFLLNFNLPKLIGRFWYRGGDGKLSQPVDEGEIEWGHFYRACMPAIWNSVDKTPMQQMLFDRINAFGQHDYQKYYYLYDVTRLPFEFSGQDSSDDEHQDGDEPSDNGEDMSTGEASSQEASFGDDSSESGSGQGGSGAESGESGQGSAGGGESGVSETSASGQGGGESQSGFGSLEEVLRTLQESLQNDLEGGSQTLQDLIDQIKQQMSQLSNQSAGSLDDQSVSASNAEGNLAGNESGSTENSESDNHEWRQDGTGNSRELRELFSQLQDIQEKMKSSLAPDEDVRKPLQELDLTDEEMTSVVESIENLEQIKQSQQRQMEALYREQSGLSGEALERYVDYREDTRNFTSDLVTYFTEKFQLDKDYTYVSNQRRGTRLQKGWTNRVLGTTVAGPVIEPTVFERKSVPKSPQFIWSLIIDNSDSCGGDIIEEEKKTAVALVEVAKQLNIPIEIVTFGGNNDYQFLKTFDQQLFGDELARLVRLNADQGTPDVATLTAACESVSDFADQFNRSYNFVYFMTDGESGSGSIASVISKFKRDMVITGIGLAGAAQSIANSWGRNSVGVEDVSQLSDVLIRKIEDQIEITFD